jgi:hypothetical protein
VTENQQTITLVVFLYYTGSVENNISIGSQDPELPTLTTFTLYAVLAKRFVIV